MFESGYLVPMAAEWLASPAPKRSLLGSILYRQLHSSNTSTFTVAWNQIQNSGLSFLINGICILSLAIILISLGPLIQIVLSSSQCGLRRRKSPNPRRQQITVFLLCFICCWFLLGTFLIASVIFLSENLDFAHPQSSSFVNRVDDVSNRTFTLLRMLANESLSLVDDAVNGLMGDVYMSILTEVPTITTQFLNHTNLNTPLAMLGDLARTVESLLSAHIHLRENGPQVASELGKLDSNIRVNGDMLLNEFKQVWKECGEVESHIPSLKPFGEAIAQLSTGLYDNQSEFVPFFQLFRLESSLGLFNMLNVLPFNVSEVTAQLKSAIKVRTELEESIKNKTVILFRSLSDQPDKVAGFLAPYMDNVVANINTTDQLYHQNMEVVKSFIYRLERMWIIIYFIGLMVLATPTVLLLSSCLRPRHSVMHPVKKVSPLLTPSEADSVVSSGRGSSDDEVSSVVSAPPTRKRQAFSGAYSELKSLDCPTVHELLVNPERSRSLSLDSDSGCPRNDSRLEKETPGSWSRTETFDSINVGTSNRFRDGCCPIGDSKYRRCRTCAHLVSCCGLLLLSLICIPLILSIGYFHIQVSPTEIPSLNYDVVCLCSAAEMNNRPLCGRASSFW
ncbi:unnamed protein product [Mesocestoides corti]|uniref:Prominin n=1 Tax=Mesocestoides corti TaxID=53468 RepID=A0A0R3U156_MESCO|nr:unnamed protein product [Mesocestoides corti]